MRFLLAASLLATFFASLPIVRSERQELRYRDKSEPASSQARYNRWYTLYTCLMYVMHDEDISVLRIGNTGDIPNNIMSMPIARVYRPEYCWHMDRSEHSGIGRTIRRAKNGWILSYGPIYRSISLVELILDCSSGYLGKESMRI